jgi:hypothetical protein
MFVTLRGEPYLLWRAVDQHGAELDVLAQKRRDKAPQCPPAGAMNGPRSRLVGWCPPGQLAGWLASMLGAIVVLVIYGMGRRNG